MNAPGPSDRDCLDDVFDLDLASTPSMIDAEIDRLRPAPDDDARKLIAMAYLRWIRHVQTTFMPGRPAAYDDLDRAADAFGEAIPLLRSDPTVEPTLLASIVSMYAYVLEARDRPGPAGRTDLDLSVTLTREAMALVPVGSADYAMALHHLGDRHVLRYERFHRTDDFVAAERALLAMLDVPGLDAADRASTWMRLGTLYDLGFKTAGNPALRDRAVDVLRSGWREGSGHALLGMSLVDRLVERGSTVDLREALGVLAEVDVAELPGPLQPEHHYCEMLAHLNLHIANPRETVDLLAAAEAAGRLIDQPETSADVRVEAHSVRANAMLDYSQITGATIDIDPVITDLDAAIDGCENQELRQTLDVRFVQALSERARRTSEPADIDRALTIGEDVMSRLPAGTMYHAQVSYHIACMLLTKSERGEATVEMIDRAIDLLRFVVDQGAAAVSVRAAAASQLSTAVIGRSYYLSGNQADLDAAIRHAETGLRTIPLAHVDRPAYAVGLASALMMRYELRGDLSDLQWCLALLTDLRDEFPGDPKRYELTLLFAQAQVAWSAATGDIPPKQTLDRLVEALREMAPADGNRAQLLRSLAVGNALRADQTEDPDEWRVAAEYARSSLSAVAADAPFAIHIRASAGGTMWLAGRALNDIELVRSAVGELAAAAQRGAGDELQSRFLGMYGAALLHMYENEPNEASLAKAIVALQEAWELGNSSAGARGSAEVGVVLAQALRSSGDLRGSAAVGREVLRANAWQVLLQSGTQNAMTAARQSASQALILARESLLAGDPHAALTALETGRGLVLHAATVAATLPDLLRIVGEHALADEWMATGTTPQAGDHWRSGAPAIPSHLRFRTLQALQQSPLLFDPPSREDLCRALTALKADCLVYLFPGEGNDPGLALVVEADGGIYNIDLPGLSGAWSVPAMVQRTTAPREVSALPESELIGRDLEKVCEAAWDIAVGRLLDHWYDRHDHEPHFVLVPSGALATVPWHAAYTMTGTPRRAIDEAGFSYIASGRLLVELARRTPPEPGGAGLVIGNPDTGDRRDDLSGAGDEATRIFLRHYAAGRFCGRPTTADVVAAGPGTPDDVFGWLDGAGVPDASVLHLACHGAAKADGPASSYLLLAGGATVSAEMILERSAQRSAGRTPGLVALAACTTHTAGRAYDEAVTLSTAFLVAGATTAIGSLWPVPDGATAELMVAFHDHLTSMPPREALRAAQRAIRDSGERVPLADWAGFVHLGH